MVLQFAECVSPEAAVFLNISVLPPPVWELHVNHALKYFRAWEKRSQSWETCAPLAHFITETQTADMMSLILQMEKLRQSPTKRISDIERPKTNLLASSSLPYVLDHKYLASSSYPLCKVDSTSASSTIKHPKGKLPLSEFYLLPPGDCLPVSLHFLVSWSEGTARVFSKIQHYCFLGPRRINADKLPAPLLNSCPSFDISKMAERLYRARGLCHLMKKSNIILDCHKKQECI